MQVVILLHMWQGVVLHVMHWMNETRLIHVAFECLEDLPPACFTPSVPQEPRIPSRDRPTLVSAAAGVLARTGVGN